MRHLVIGYKGSIGSRHYRLLQEAGEEVYGIDFDSTNDSTFIDHDMWWVCVPELSKDFYVKKALELGKKVFVEKPYSSTLSGDIFVACNYRFHPAVQVLKENLHKVGEVLYSRMHFSHYLPNQRKNWKEYMKDTNIVLDVGWHFVDLALWLFGKSVNYGGGRKKIEFDFEDKGWRWIDHISGCETFIDIDYLRRDKSWGIEIIGKEGTLKLISEGKNPELVSVIRFHKTTQVEYLLQEKIVYPDEEYKNQLDYLLKNEWKSNINQAIEVMKICQ